MQKEQQNVKVITGVRVYFYLKTTIDMHFYAVLGIRTNYIHFLVLKPSIVPLNNVYNKPALRKFMLNFLLITSGPQLDK